MAVTVRIPLWARIVIGLGLLVNLAILADLIPDSVERLWLQLVANAVLLVLALWLLVRGLLACRTRFLRSRP